MWDENYLYDLLHHFAHLGRTHLQNRSPSSPDGTMQRVGRKKIVLGSIHGDIPVHRKGAGPAQTRTDHHCPLQEKS